MWVWVCGGIGDWGLGNLGFGQVGFVCMFWVMGNKRAGLMDGWVGGLSFLLLFRGRGFYGRSGMGDCEKLRNATQRNATLTISDR